MGLLSVGATINHIGIRESSVPHHDATPVGAGVEGSDSAGENTGRLVVDSTARRSSRSKLRGGDTKEKFGIGGRCTGDVRNPVSVVESVGVRAVSVVVELDPEVVELSSGNDLTHVRLWDGALGGTGNVVGVGRVRREVGAELRDHVLVVLVTAISFDIKVPTVNEDRSEWSRNAASRGVSIGLPEVLADCLGFSLGSERVGTNGTTKGKHNLDTVGLASFDLASEGVTVGTLTGGADRAVLSNDTGGDRNAISILIKECKDNNIDTGACSTVG